MNTTTGTDTSSLVAVAGSLSTNSSPSATKEGMNESRLRTSSTSTTKCTVCSPTPRTASGPTAGTASTPASTMSQCPLGVSCCVET